MVHIQLSWFAEYDQIKLPGVKCKQYKKEKDWDR